MPTVEELQEMERVHLGDNGFDPEDAEGMSIEDMADAGVMPEEPEKEESSIEGATNQLNATVGGRKPDAATFRMGAREVKLTDRTQFAKGSMVKLDVLARVDEVKFRDKHDDAGDVTHTTRVHLALPINVVRLGERDRLVAAVLDLADSLEASNEFPDGAGVRAEIERVVRQTLDERE